MLSKTCAVVATATALNLLIGSHEKTSAQVRLLQK
jgi:hypothetical protein